MSLLGRILIVDDDPIFQETYRDFLLAEGYEVVGVHTAEEARKGFRDPGIGLIILDQKLRGPGGPDEGADLAAEAARLAPGAKVIIATVRAAAWSFRSPSACWYTLGRAPTATTPVLARRGSARDTKVSSWGPSGRLSAQGVMHRAPRK